MPFWRRSATDSQLDEKVKNHNDNKNGRTNFLSETDGKRHLPVPRGPHSVGYVDLMTPGAPHEDKGSFIRILYPTKEKTLDNVEKWPIWEEDAYITGMLSFMQVLENSI